jgi:hypothetical protein
MYNGCAHLHPAPPVFSACSQIKNSGYIKPDIVVDKIRHKWKTTDM